MARTAPRLAGRLLNSSGAGISGATVHVYDAGTTTPSRADVATGSDGSWAIGPNESGDAQIATGRGAFDVQLNDGTTKLRIVQNTEAQFKSIELVNVDSGEAPLLVAQMNDGASVPVAIFEGDRSTDALGSSGSETDDDEAYISLRLANDADEQTEMVRLTWVATDVSNASEDGRLEFQVMVSASMADKLQLDGTALSPMASDGLALGTAALEWSDLFLADAAVISFGDDQEVTLTHVHDTGILLSSTDQLQFGDSGTYIHQSADGVLDLVSDTEIEINATTIDLNGAVAMDGAITGGTNITLSGELDAATLDISGNADIDGSLAVGNLTLANGSITDSGGALDFGNETLTTTGAVDFGTATVDSLSVSDANITNVADIALDSISADGTDINVAVSDNSATALTIKQGSDAYLIVDTANSSESVAIGTGISGTAISIGHTTSETTVNDNLTVTGDLTVSGATTTVDTTNTVAKDSLIELNNGASSNSNDLGIVMERGSTGDNAIIAWDESADGFTVGTTTATGASTGNLTITAAPFTAAAIVGTTIEASTNFTIGDTVITDGVVTDSTGLQLAANLDIDGTADISGDLTLSAGGDGALRFSAASSIKILDNSSAALVIEEADNAYITFVTTNSSEAITVAKATTFSAGIANAGTIAAGTWTGTDVGVAYGGTGASTLTDGGVLLGSGTGAITAMSVLADSEMIVGDGSTDPVAESGATLRTSIGVAVTREGGQTTEVTTSSTSTVDLLTAVVSLAAAPPILGIANLRKTTGAVDDVKAGLKLNGVEVSSPNPCTSTTNIARSGIIRWWLGGRVTDYLKAGQIIGEDDQGFSFTNGISSNDIPTATITAFIMRAKVDDSDITMGGDEMHVYSYASS